MANAVALGIASDGSAIPIRLTPAGLLSVSGGSGSVQGPGNYKGESFVLMGIASDGQITPIAVDSSGNIQTSGSSSGGSGTVTSVGLTVPSILSVTGSPVTSSGTLAISLATQSANTIFAGPTSGGVVAPAFRALVGADLPATITKATAFNIAGAASAPALSVTGVPFAGTGTTSFPQLYLNDSTATASTTLSTAGTYLGVNGHGTADLANFMVDGVSKFKVVTASVTLGTHLLFTDNTYDIGASGATRPRSIYVATSFNLVSNGQSVSISVDGSANTVFDDASGSDMRALYNGNLGFGLTSAASFFWTSGATTGTRDLALYRDAANILAQRNGTTAQQFRLYNTYTDASNGEWVRFEWISNVFNMMTNYNGTGGGRELQIGTGGGSPLSFKTTNTTRWQIDSNGHFNTGLDNTYDIGASGATRPRNLYLAGIATLGGVPRFNGTNTTGAGSALLGANSPASTLTAPYTWIQVTTSDGSTAYIPCWK